MFIPRGPKSTVKTGDRRFVLGLRLVVGRSSGDGGGLPSLGNPGRVERGWRERDRARDVDEGVE